MWNCYNCGRTLRPRSVKHIVVTEEGEEVPVGSDCVQHIREAGTDGFFSEGVGELLFTHSAYAQREAEGD